MNPVRTTARRAAQSATSATRASSRTVSQAPRRALSQSVPSQNIAITSKRPAPLSRTPHSPFTNSQARRTLFIQTEATPNADALKFKPNTRVIPEDLPTPFLEYNTPRSTLAAPYPSPLAASLLSVDGVTSVFYGADYITVTKDSGTNWGHVKPEIFSLITESVTAGEPMVKKVEGAAAEGEDAQGAADTMTIEDSDSETVQMIKELLDTRIRPAIQEDGGDIEYRGLRDGWVLLKLRGACRTCDSSTVTLRNGIESMLMHYIPEVHGVEQVMDQEEEVAMAEFAKFEEKLRQQKGDAAVASTGGKGTLDSAEA